MKLKKIKKKKATQKAKSQNVKGGGIVLGDGTKHTKEHEKAGYWVGMWNGEKYQCRVVNVKVLDTEDSIHSHPWWKPYVGDTFQAIEVNYYGNQFYISNVDGSGMYKVTAGRGMMTAGHAQFEEVEVLDTVLNQKEWIMEFSMEKSAEVAKKGDAYWMEKDPEHYRSIVALREAMVGAEKAKKKAHERKKSTNFLHKR